MDQQKQAKQYFDAVAADWQSKAVGRPDEYPLIEMRHRAVHSIIKDCDNARHLLDVGCGTGQLAIEAADLGMSAVGIDFAPEMIATCETNRAADNSKATFICGSIFDYQAPSQPFDVVSAQGFIEYISPDEMEMFFAQAARMLRQGGALAVASRNRLFNVVSLNRYTAMERDLGLIDRLVDEATAITGSVGQPNMLRALHEFEQIMPQPKQHPHTGIGVSIRYQYTPGELIYRLRRHGFAPHRIYPVHFHGLPLAVKLQKPAMHAALAMEVESLSGNDHSILPFCSSYVLDVRKV